MIGGAGLFGFFCVGALFEFVQVCERQTYAPNNTQRFKSGFGFAFFGYYGFGFGKNFKILKKILIFGYVFEYKFKIILKNQN